MARTQLASALRVLLPILLMAGCTTWPTADGRRRVAPNIIFILADDLGWAELGSYGNPFNETPSLDRLARDGMRFTQAYAAAPVCSPYRASLMTGQYPARLGITDYLRPDDPSHLPRDLVTLPELLRDAGYATGLVGKWHLSGYAQHGAVESPPSEHGFEEVLLSETRGIGEGSYFHPYAFNPEIERRLPEPEHLVDRVNLEAVEFIERHRREPFLLYVSHYAVHTRLEGRPDLVRKHRRKARRDGWRSQSGQTAHLAAQLEVIDHGVGLIVRKLEQLGLADDTILIFTSDNGGESGVTSNGPLRGGKSTLYEGGLRVPLIVRWPGRVAASTRSDRPVSSIDFYPTLAEVAGARLEPGQPVDGISILPTLAGRERPPQRDTLYWHYPLERPHFLGGSSAGAVRMGEWKLIEDFGDGSVELFDLARDPGEEVDLSADLPEKVRELRYRLEFWRHDLGVRVPRGEPDPVDVSKP
jgi:arylsulfatase A-like enzyme